MGTPTVYGSEIAFWAVPVCGEDGPAERVTQQGTMSYRFLSVGFSMRIPFGDGDILVKREMDGTGYVFIERWMIG